MYQNFIIQYLYEAKHVLGDTLPIIRSLKLYWQPLVFRTWKVDGRVVGGRCQAHYDATMYQNFIIPYLYEAEHVSGDTPTIIRSLKLHWRPLVFRKWKVDGCVVGGRYQGHYDATVYQNFIIRYLYEAQHVSGDAPPIIRSPKLHWQPLVFHTWKVDGRVVGGRCQAQYVPDNVHQPSTCEKPETASAVFGS